MSNTQPEVIGVFAVVKQYNDLLPHDRRRLGLQRSTKSEAHVAAAKAFLAWCAQHDVRDPLLYIRTRMSISKHLVRFDALASEGVIEAYRERFAPRMLNARLLAKDPRERQYVRALAMNARMHEIVRRDYASTQQTHLCLAQPELSGGYHPMSPNCGACAHGAPCAQRLNEREGFNVVALRLNRLDLLPQEIASAVQDHESATAHAASARASQ